VVHRVEQVAHLAIGPDDRPLDFRQGDLAEIDLVEQGGRV